MTGMTWGPDAVGPGTAARWGRWGPRPEDVLLAIASAVLALVSLTGRISPLGEFDEDWLLHFRGADGLGIGLVLLASAGLLLLRWRALVSLAIVDTCMFALHALGYLPPPLPAAELVVLYALATTRSIVVSALAASVTALSIVVADLLHDVSLDDDKLVAYLLAVVMACMVGYVVQVSRAQTRIAEENVRLLAEQQEARTHIAVREEKARLTRELHDIVAHGIGVMVALASAGRLAPGDRAHGAVQALAAVEDTGRAALVEMRTVMRDLHGDRRGLAADAQRRGARCPGRADPGRRARGRPPASRATRARCRARSTRPPSAWSRSRSPTRCATPARATCRCASATAPR